MLAIHLWTEDGVSNEVLKRVLALETMGMGELKEYWQAVMGQPAPKYPRSYLVKRLAYRLQEQAEASLTPLDYAKARDILSVSGFDVEGTFRKKAPERRKQIALEPGQRLHRHWQGQHYEVLGLEGGEFEFRGRRYRSLTAVMKQITPTPWNPRQFFGLDKPSTKRTKKN